MLSKITIAIVTALVLGSASVALAAPKAGALLVLKPGVCVTDEGQWSTKCQTGF